MNSIEAKIRDAVRKFALTLRNKTVLTEAATGSYCVTPLIAALAGAKVYAYTKDSSYGLIKEASGLILGLARKMGIEKRVAIVRDLDKIRWREIDILTNVGLLRPINRLMLARLSSRCVIPLMWEPWEYRRSELNLDVCRRKGIKVYGTNENDRRLKTIERIGFVLLRLLLEQGLPPLGVRILLIGCERLVLPAEKILRQNNYTIFKITDYRSAAFIKDVDAIVVLEHERKLIVIGDKGAFINKREINPQTLVIHICGGVSFKNAEFRHIPERPRPFGYMSLITELIGLQAVIDLHTAGLKVAEGMLEANRRGLKGLAYKIFMEKGYPALAFDDSRLW